MTEGSESPPSNGETAPTQRTTGRQRTVWIIAGGVTVVAVVAVVVTVLLVTGGGAPKTAAPQTKKVSRFIELVRADTSTTLRSASKSKLIQVGRQVCAVFKEGDGYGTADGILRGSAGMTPFQSWLFIGLAVTVFCPQFHNQVPPHSPPPP